MFAGLGAAIAKGKSRADEFPVVQAPCLKSVEQADIESVKNLSVVWQVLLNVGITVQGEVLSTSLLLYVNEEKKNEHYQIITPIDGHGSHPRD